MQFSHLPALLALLNVVALTSALPVDTVVAVDMASIAACEKTLALAQMACIDQCIADPNCINLW